MKGFLCSQDGAYAFPLGPKVTTIGRENCDISINSSTVDPQHALLEYDPEQRSFVVKDLNSSTGTYVNDCRIQNITVRLADGDGLRFGVNGLPLEFRVEQQISQQRESTMPSIYPRANTSNPLQVITQTIPSAKSGVVLNNFSQQIDSRQNSGFSLKPRPVSAGNRKIPPFSTNGHVGHESRELRPIPNAWTTATTCNPSRSVLNGSFIGELSVGGQDNTELTSRVDQLEREVKGRDDEIRRLNDRIRGLEPMGSSFSNEVHSLKAELDKVRREKQAASGLISSLQRDLHSKESNMAKLSREIETLKSDSRDKDLRLQSLQGKVGHQLNLIRDRSRAEEDRNSKDRESRIKVHEQQIADLNENINRLKSQLQDTEKQILKLTKNEQSLRQECEQIREQLSQSQQSEAALKNDLTELQRKYREFCISIWHCCPSSEENDEFDDDQSNIIEQIQKMRQDYRQTQEDLENEKNTHLSFHDALKSKCQQLSDLIMNTMNQQVSVNRLRETCQQIETTDETDDDESVIGKLKRTLIHALESQLRLISSMNGLVLEPTDSPDDSTIDEILSLLKDQYENFEREKENLRESFTERQNELRSEFDRTLEEKDSSWQIRLNEETDRLRSEIEQSRTTNDDQINLLNDRLEALTAENNNLIEKHNNLQAEMNERINTLTDQLRSCQEELSNEKQKTDELAQINQTQAEQISQIEREKSATIVDLNGQIEVFRDQVRQFSITIVQLEKKYDEEREKNLRLQTDFDILSKKPPSPELVSVRETPVPMMPVLTLPMADISQELFAHKARVQEQEQIIISLRRDLAGMAARLSDVQGELSDKQKRALEKNETIIREQTKELNETRLKLSKLSEIVDKQTQQIDVLQSDLSKSKVLNDEYQKLVDQRQAEIDRLYRSVEEKNLTVARVEKINEDEGRITHELVAIGAQCKGERHEQTIGRQREALNELRARIKSLEQLRPANPSYEKVLQQVVLLKRELAELRARQALPTEIPNIMGSSNAASIQHSTTRSAGTIRQSPSGSFLSDPTVEAQKILEERAAHAETMTSFQASDDLYNTFIRKLVQILDIDDDTVLEATSLTTIPPVDRYVVLQQRQRATEILIQKIEMLRERLSRKEELLRDYEKDLGKLRQAEILLREKDNLLQDLEIDKRSKDDEALFLRNTLRETQDTLNQEKRVNASIKLGRNVETTQTTDLIRRSGGSTLNLHHHCPPDASGKIRTVKRNMNGKILRKDYEIKSLKQELHEALDRISDQSHQVKLLEIKAKQTGQEDGK